MGPPRCLRPTPCCRLRSSARAEAYAGPARWLGWSSLAVSLAVVCWLGFTRAGQRLVGRLPGWWWVRVLLGVALVSLVGRLATLPFSFVSYRRRVSYGLTTQEWPGWLRDVATSWAVNVVGTCIVLLLVVGTARRWRTWWPAVAGDLAAALVMIGSFVYPVLVEPLFNDFKPLHDGPAARRRAAAGAGRGGARRGRPGGRRVPPYDDPQRLRVRVRRHPPSGALRQPGARRAARGGPLGGRPRAGPRALRRRPHGSLLGAAGAVAGIGLLGLLLGRRDRRGRPREDGPEMQKPPAIRRWCHGSWPWWRWRACWRVLSRTGSAGRSRPGPTWTRCGDGRPGRLRRAAEAARDQVSGRSDGARLVAVLVRQPPDDA